METRYERVYALGDVVSIPLKLGKGDFYAEPVPQ